MKQQPEHRQQTKYGSWPSEGSEVSLTPSLFQQSQAENSVKSLLQPSGPTAFMKNKKRNESSNWMKHQATAIPSNMQQFNYGPRKVQTFVDDKIDFSAYEQGKNNFQNFVQGDANLPAGAYYDTPAYIDPTTGKMISYELPSAGASVQPSQQIKILEVNMRPKMTSPRDAQKSLPMQQPCNNPNCTGCRGK